MNWLDYLKFRPKNSEGENKKEEIERLNVFRRLMNNLSNWLNQIWWA